VAALAIGHLGLIKIPRGLRAHEGLPFFLFYFVHIYIRKNRSANTVADKCLPVYTVRVYQTLIYSTSIFRARKWFAKSEYYDRSETCGWIRIVHKTITVSSKISTIVVSPAYSINMRTHDRMIISCWSIKKYAIP